MDVKRVSRETLQDLSFAHRRPIILGDAQAVCTIRGVTYVASLSLADAYEVVTGSALDDGPLAPYADVDAPDLDERPATEAELSAHENRLADDAERRFYK